MKKLMIALAALFALSTSALAQMNNTQGNNMMGDSWGSRWGMGYGFGFGWIIVIILAVLVIFGIVYMMKRK